MPADRSRAGRSPEASTPAEAHCARFADLDRASLEPVHFSGPPERCDACGKPIAGQRFFGDCEFPGQGGWGHACPACIADWGLRFGWGQGQLYRRTDEAEPRWLMVAGFPPTDMAG